MNYKTRKSNFNNVPCSVSIEKELLARMKAYCDSEGISFSKLTNKLLKEYARKKGIIG